MICEMCKGKDDDCFACDGLGNHCDVCGESCESDKCDDCQAEEDEDDET